MVDVVPSDRVTTWQLTRVMLAARLRAQLSYRGSFVGDVASQALLALTELAEVWVLLHNAPVFGGMTLTQACVVYGITAVAFGLADMVFGQLDRINLQLRTGQLETLLVRPVPLLLQLITADVQLRRLGRVVFGLVVYGWALSVAVTDWTPAAIALSIVAPLAGALIFGALFLAAGSFQFWLIDGAQAGNSITYGGKYVASMPAGALIMPVRVFFTFVVPATLVGFVPAAVLTGAPIPWPLTAAMAWLGLPVAALMWVVVALLWRAAVRHYTGAGG